VLLLFASRSDYAIQRFIYTCMILVLVLIFEKGVITRAQLMPLQLIDRRIAGAEPFEWFFSASQLTATL
jgi:hypothetical protein